MLLLDKGNAALRRAIQNNVVSFPSQVPVFPKQCRADIQWRVAQLYFVRGWTEADIGVRFGLSRQRVLQVLNNWRMRAITLGYIQPIVADESVPPNPGKEYRGTDNSLYVSASW